MYTNAVSYVKIVQTSRPGGGANLWPKFQILTVLGAVFPFSVPINMVFDTGRGPVVRADLWSTPPAKFYFYWAMCCSCGAKIHFCHVMLCKRA